MSQNEINLNVEMAMLLVYVTLGMDATTQRARVTFARVMVDTE